MYVALLFEIRIPSTFRKNVGFVRIRLHLPIGGSILSVDGSCTVLSFLACADHFL